MSDTVKYLLEESRLPKEWYNIVADLPRPPDPVLHPGTLQPVGPADLEPLFPMALIAQEVSDGADDRNSRAGPRDLPAVAPLAALSSPPAGEGARYSRQDLLQIRGRQPGRQP